MIPVTRPHLPKKSRYLGYISRCYENCQLMKKDCRRV